MVNEIVYPSSITCEIVPEYTDNFESMTDGKSVEELIDSEKLDILGDEHVKPMTEYVKDIETSLSLNGE